MTATRETVPAHVAAAITKALNKLPADRFATASAFAEALTAPGSVQLSEVTPTSAATPAARKRDRLKLGLAAAVAAWSAEHAS